MAELKSISDRLSDGYSHPESLAPRLAGPKTQAGKTKSKSNAVKHGIFSQVVLSRRESGAELDSLLRGLRVDLNPSGTLEEVLVDKLAVLLWRQRRLVISEAEKPQTTVEQIAFDADMKLSLRFDLQLRYESNLERAFDRTLGQLERLQRIRAGLPVTPILNVDVST